MPSHGVEIIEGIPVILRDGIMYSFHPGTTQGSMTTSMKLGTYNQVTKKATWNSSDSMDSWLLSYRESLTPRSRKKPESFSYGKQLLRKAIATESIT